MQAAARIVESILTQRASVPSTKALLVGLSGIDGGGKGYVAAQVAAALTAQGLKTASINVDGWLNLPNIRYDPALPGENFYENAFRLDELFSQLILPIREKRSVCVTMEWVDETANATRPYTHSFEDLGIIVLEGVYIFKRAYRGYFDLAIWLDCSWETAPERSTARAQEGLPPKVTVRVCPIRGSQAAWRY